MSDNDPRFKIATAFLSASSFNTQVESLEFTKPSGVGKPGYPGGLIMLPVFFSSKKENLGFIMRNPQSGGSK